MARRDDPSNLRRSGLWIGLAAAVAIALGVAYYVVAIGGERSVKLTGPSDGALESPAQDPGEE